MIDRIVQNRPDYRISKREIDRDTHIIIYHKAHPELDNTSFYEKKPGDVVLGSQERGYNHFSYSRRGKYHIKRTDPSDNFLFKELRAYFDLTDMINNNFRINIPLFLGAYLREFQPGAYLCGAYICTEYVEGSIPFLIYTGKKDAYEVPINFNGMPDKERQGIILSIARQLAYIHKGNILWPDQLLMHNLLFVPDAEPDKKVVCTDLESAQKLKKLSIKQRAIPISVGLKWYADHSKLFANTDEDWHAFYREYILTFDSSVTQKMQKAQQRPTSRQRHSMEYIESLLERKIKQFQKKVKLEYEKYKNYKNSLPIS